MKTLSSTLVFCLCVLSLNAQDLSSKISDKAFGVFTINGAKTLASVDEAAINKSLLFHEVISEFFRGEEEILSLQEFGIDLQKRIFFVGESGQDVSFVYLTYNIGNLSTFEKTVKEKIQSEKFEQKDGLNILYYAYDSRLYWNSETAIFITGNYVGEEYAYNYWEDYSYREYAEATEMTVEVPLEDMTDEEWIEYMKKSKEENEKAELERQLADQEREKKRIEKQRLLEEKVAEEIELRVKSFFSDELKNANTQLKYKWNDEADASVYYANNMSIMELFLGLNRPYYYNPYRSMFGFGDFFNGSVAADLFLNQTSIDLEAKITYPDNLVDDYSKMLSKKIDKNFSKYISSKDLGYMSMSYNTEDLLNAYPNIIENMMLRYDTAYADEYSIIADLFNLIVDEESIANAITGDAVFIFNSLSNKEVEYYTYEYDEEYNYERKLSTRMELVPEFTFLMGSKEDVLIKKMFKIAVKHEGLVVKGQGYQLIDKYKDFPFEMYFGYKDNIVLICTSSDKLDEFFNGGSSSKISKAQLKDITKNSGAVYMNLNSLLTSVLEGDLGKSEKRVFTEMRDQLTTISATVSNKGGQTIMSATAPVPSTEANGALYLLHFIDAVIKADKNRD